MFPLKRCGIQEFSVCCISSKTIQKERNKKTPNEIPPQVTSNLKAGNLLGEIAEEEAESKNRQ